MEIDYYHLLGVQPNSTRKEIKLAYRRMAEVYHPDKLRHLPPSVRSEGEEIMRLLNDAKSILMDPDRRYIYDCRMGNAENKQDAIIVQEFEKAVSYEPEYYIALEKEEVSSMMSRVLTGLREVFVRDPDFQIKIDFAQEIVEAKIIEEQPLKNTIKEGTGSIKSVKAKDQKKHHVTVIEEEPQEIEMTLEFQRITGKDKDRSSAPGSKSKKKGFRIVAIEGEETDTPDEDQNSEIEWED
jgi:curved DNA-binding protein CbpA